jgi:predicted regulator of Ras-like GTPase activity (Roadblock/LC7/MglB family)
MSQEVKIDPELHLELMRVLDRLESSTDLEGTALITRQGFRIASVSDTNITADIYAVAPAMLLNLGKKITSAMNYGSTSQILITGTEGYTIITTREDSNFMLITHCRQAAKLGYYFHRLQKAFGEFLGMLANIEVSSAVY